MQESYKDFRLNNWVIYFPEGNYCRIKALLPQLVLQGALQNYSCTIEQVGSVKIAKDKLQVFGFEVDYPTFRKTSNKGIHVSVVFKNSGIYKFCIEEEAFCNVRFIHEVQNAYYKITGELLEGNLYGVREEGGW